MASITTINVGTTADDDTGDDLRTGGQTINANFSAVNAEVEAATAAIAALGALSAEDTVSTSLLDDGAVTLAKFQDIATASILGRDTGGTGAVEVLDAATVRAFLGVEAGATADQSALEIETLYNSQVALVDLATAQAGSSGTVFRWSPVRIAQLVDARAQPLDSDLTAVAGLATTGLISRTGSGTAAARTLTAPAAGLTITNPAGIAGNPTFALANDLLAVENLSTTGIPARTGTSTWSVRTLTAPAAGLTITNPGGVTGNPTFSLANDLAALEGLASTGIPARTGSDTWAQRTITAGTGIGVTNGDGVSGNPTIAVSGLDDANVAAAASATNYTPGSSTVDGHLSGIDTALGTVNTALTEFDRVVTATGGTTTLAEATHRNALIVLASGTNTVTAPSSDTGVWVVSVLNDTATDQTVAGQTVSAGSLTSIVVDGTTATPFSTSQTKKVPVFIQTGADAVLFNGEIFDGAFTVLTARHVCASGSITIEIALESGDNTGSFTAVTSLSALSVTTTRATGTASGANTSSTGAARVRITGSSNSSATGIELSLRVRV